MEPLMHWDILDENRIGILRDIVRNVDIGEYYLAGGTALSLQMGLRDSVDFDFFVPGAFDAAALPRQIEAIFPGREVVAHEVNSNTCNMTVDDVRVSFLGYPYGMLEPYVTTAEMPGLNMARVRDIAEMKLAAIGGRGAKKDFFDLYQVLTRTDITMEELTEGLYEKFGENDFSYIGMGLNYFDDADPEKLASSHVPYDWNGIKEYFTDIQDEIMQHLSDGSLSSGGDVA